MHTSPSLFLIFFFRRIDTGRGGGHGGPRGAAEGAASPAGALAVQGARLPVGTVAQARCARWPALARGGGARGLCARPRPALTRGGGGARTLPAAVLGARPARGQAMARGLRGVGGACGLPEGAAPCGAAARPARGAGGAAPWRAARPARGAGEPAWRAGLGAASAARVPRRAAPGGQAGQGRGQRGPAREEHAAPWRARLGGTAGRPGRAAPRGSRSG